MFSEFHFFKFEPDKKLRHHANSMLHRVLDLVPDGSSCEATVDKMKDQFKALVQIVSAAGKFSTEVVAKTAHEAIDLADGKLREQIEKWQQDRFSVKPVFSRT